MSLDPAEREELLTRATDAAWKQFAQMLSSNPGDLARHAIKAIEPTVEAIAARAWDEGYHRGVRDEAGDIERADNPYRDDDGPEWTDEQHAAYARASMGEPR